MEKLEQNFDKDEMTDLEEQIIEHAPHPGLEQELDEIGLTPQNIESIMVF